jgi:hypothetical protein
MATDEKIRNLAYGIWEQEGRPEGKDVAHYLRAKKIVEQQETLRVIELAPSSPVVELALPPKPIHLPRSTHKRNIRDQHMKK